MNKEKIANEIRETEERLRVEQEILVELRRKLEEKEVYPKPGKNQRYWYIDSSGNIDYAFWGDGIFGNKCYNIGNVFLTKEHAESESFKSKHFALQALDLLTDEEKELLKRGY